MRYTTHVTNKSFSKLFCYLYRQLAGRVCTSVYGGARRVYDAEPGVWTSRTGPESTDDGMEGRAGAPGGTGDAVSTVTAAKKGAKKGVVVVCALERFAGAAACVHCMHHGAGAADPAPTTSAQGLDNIGIRAARIAKHSACHARPWAHSWSEYAPSAVLNTRMLWYCDSDRQTYWRKDETMPRKHGKALEQCWFNVGPAS